MGRVTIDHLDFDFNHTEIEKHDDCSMIEVVPRKMVEMIIEKCKQDSAQPFYHDCIIEEARDIKRYAESLLKQFEEGEENVRN